MRVITQFYSPMENYHTVLLTNGELSHCFTHKWRVITLSYSPMESYHTVLLTNGELSHCFTHQWRVITLFYSPASPILSITEHLAVFTPQLSVFTQYTVTQIVTHSNYDQLHSLIKQLIVTY